MKLHMKLHKNKDSVTCKMNKTSTIVDDLHSTIQYIARGTANISFYSHTKSNGVVYAIRGPKKNPIVMLHYENDPEITNRTDKNFIKHESDENNTTNSPTKATDLDIEFVLVSSIQAIVTSDSENASSHVIDSINQLDKVSTSRSISCGQKSSEKLATSVEKNSETTVNREVTHDFTSNNDRNLSSIHLKDVVEENQTSLTLKQSKVNPSNEIPKKDKAAQLLEPSDGNCEIIFIKQEVIEDTEPVVCHSVENSDPPEAYEEGETGQNLYGKAQPDELESGSELEPMEIVSVSYNCDDDSQDEEIYQNTKNVEADKTNVLIVQCCHCGKRIPMADAHIPNIHIQTGEKPYLCSCCYELVRHMLDQKCDQTIKSQGIFRCPECRVAFPNSVSYNVHMQENRFKCSVCDKKFCNQKNLTVHSKIHSGPEIYYCEECDINLNTKSNLQHHKLLHSGVKRYECHQCDKKFYYKSHLKRHELTHSGEKPFECPQCNKKFSDKSNLALHKRVHSGVKKHQCSLCEKKYFRKSQLLIHSLIHSGDKLYECSQCDKKFIHKRSIDIHERIHSGVKPYQCSICDRKFNDICSLNRHKAVHSVDKPFQCLQCDKKFSHRMYLKRHSRVHS